MNKITVKAWTKKGEKLFGKNQNNWFFKCPGCGKIQSVNSLIAEHKGMGLEGYFGASVYYRCGDSVNADSCTVQLDNDAALAELVVINKEGGVETDVPVFEFKDTTEVIDAV